MWGLLKQRGVEGWVPRGEDLRTPSDPEGSSGKQKSSGAAGKPSLSWRVAASPDPDRQRVHGLNFSWVARGVR